MFSGFPTTNTPAFQVWNFANAQTGSGSYSISLTDDCAPIQYFRTGASVGQIAVYLPGAPPEGKVITVVNHKYGSLTQQVAVYYPDAIVGGAVQYFALGVGQTITFCFSRLNQGYGPTGGYQRTGWVMLNQAGSSASGYYGLSLGDGSHATGNQSIVLGGTGNTASATASLVAGGSGNTAGGSYAAVIGGQSTVANGTYAGVLAGVGAIADGTGSAVVGGYYGTTRTIAGRTVFPASTAPISSNNGVQQCALLILGVQTTDATVTILRSNTSAAATTNQLVLPNNSAYYVRGSCIANVTAAGNTKAWTFEAVIKRGANAASTALVAAVTPIVTAADAGAATWTIAVSADTTNGALAVSVTGQAATTIRWVCRLDSTEVTY